MRALHGSVASNWKICKSLKNLRARKRALQTSWFGRSHLCSADLGALATQADQQVSVAYTANTGADIRAVCSTLTIRRTEHKTSLTQTVLRSVTFQLSRVPNATPAWHAGSQGTLLEAQLLLQAVMSRSGCRLEDAVGNTRNKSCLPMAEACSSTTIKS